MTLPRYSTLMQAHERGKLLRQTELSERIQEAIDTAPDAEAALAAVGAVLAAEEDDIPHDPPLNEMGC